MVDSAYPLFPIAAFIGFAVALIPLSWHASAWNAGTCMYMFWVSTTCLAEFINAIVWKGNLLNPAPIWCDITAKLFVGAGVGLPAASLCINRRLFNITSGKTVFITRADRFRTMMEDLAVSAGIPFLVMVLHIVVQGHRFNILEDVGCASVTFNTLPAYFLVFMWPVLLGSISFIYAGLTLRRFIVHRAEVTGVITNHAFLNVNRYFRLMVFATIDMMAVVPISVFNIYIGTKGVDLAPWISWADTHFDFQRVEFIPAIVWKTDGAFFISVEMGRWVYPLSSIVFFGVFGFTAEARKSYRRITYWFARQVGWTRLADVVSTTRPSPLPLSAATPSFNKKAGSKPNLSVYIQSPPPRYAFRDGSASSLSPDTTPSTPDVEKGFGSSMKHVPFRLEDVRTSYAESIPSSAYVTASPSRRSISISSTASIPMASDERPISARDPIPTPIHDKMTQS